MTGSATRTLNVTQEDISAGTHSAHGCPFALAARRLFPGWESVTVVSGRLKADVHLVSRVAVSQYAFEQWDLDEAGRAAIVRYDTAGTMEPGAYTLTRNEAAERQESS